MDPASNGGFHTLTVPDDWLEEPARVQSAPRDDEFERPQFFDAVTGQPSNRPPTTAPAPVRRKCGARARTSRGRPVRVRGSRRSTAASQSASSADPDLGDEPPRYRPSLRQGAMA
jgi:hypothetical protein